MRKVFSISFEDFEAISISNGLQSKTPSIFYPNEFFYRLHQKKKKNLYLTLINSLTRTRDQINNKGFFDLLERQNFLFQLN